MDYTSRLRGDDVFPLVQDGENKVISADDLMENIGNAIENQHHKHHCCHENPEIELDEIKCQAAKASLDSKEAKALAQDALSIGKEALEQSDQALDLATRANDKANAALKETDKISTIEDNITILTSQTNLNTKYLQQEISDRKDGNNNLQKQIDNLSSSTAQNIQNIQNTLSSEINSRISQDNYLQTEIDTNTTKIAQVEKEIKDSQAADVTELKRLIAEETNNRIYADKSQDKVIETVNQNLANSVNAINTNVANGFTAINTTTTKLQSDIDKVASDLNAFISSTDTDGIINKWTEVENFLTSIDQNETLAGLLKKEEEKVNNLTYAASYTGNSLNSGVITISAETHTLGEYVFVQVFMNGQEITPNIFNDDGNITIYGNSGSGTSWKTTDTILVQLIKITKINNSYN